jgi:putative phosphoribosyl transferase
MRFADRADAGRRLAVLLESERGENPVVLGLPRGGVAVAHEVARALDAPLDVIVVRKLGVPWLPEFAMGALGEGGTRILDEETVELARVTPEQIAEVERAESAELARRSERYRAAHQRVPLEGRCAIVVDDGIATGATARAACAVAARQGAARVVLAVPVLPPDVIDPLSEVADRVVWLEAPVRLDAVGSWYRDFEQLTDDDVLRLLSS